MTSRSVNEFVDHLQTRARYTFARTEVEEALKLGAAALTKGLQRAQRAGRNRMIRRGFYVIVLAGCLNSSGDGVGPGALRTGHRRARRQC